MKRTGPKHGLGFHADSSSKEERPSAAVFVSSSGLDEKSSFGAAPSSGESIATRLKVAAAAVKSGQSAATSSATGAPSKAALQRAKMAALLEDATRDKKPEKNKAWGRQDMRELGAKMKSDEVDSVGHFASHSTEVGDRAAMIARINSDTEESIYVDTAQESGSISREEGLQAAGVKRHGAHLEVSHHDAMFAPTGSYVPSAPVEAPPASSAAPSDRTQRVGDITKLRARFERPPSPLRNKEEATEGAPLWKRLQVGQMVEARSSVDGQWYGAQIRQVVHGGYANASFTVAFHDFDDACEAKSWRELRLRPDLYPMPSPTSPPSSLKRPRPSEDTSSSAASEPSRDVPSSAGAASKDAASESTPAAVEPLAINPALLQRAQSGGGWRARARRAT
jgi:hypothetical protein